MPQQNDNSNDSSYVEYIDMGLGDPNLEGWDGRSSRIDPGFYDLEVTEAAMGVSGKGNPTLRLTYRVISEGPMQGRTTRQSYAILPDNDGARRRMKNLIDALGVETDENHRFAPASMVGTQMRAEAIIEPYTDFDSRTGQNVTKEAVRIVGEEPLMVEEAPAPQQRQAPVQQRQAPQGRPVAQRRPGNNQGPQVRR